MKATAELAELLKTDPEWRRFFKACCETEHTADLLGSSPEERILRKFSHPECERRSRRGESSLVTKTGHPSGTAVQGIFCGGGGR